MDYYAVLGLQASDRRRISAADIREKFRYLSRQFHPDHHSPELQKSANDAFGQLDRSYKVLSDPITRRLYDDFGELGVRAFETNVPLTTAVGAHLKTPEEICKYVQKCLRHEKRKELLAHFDSHTQVEMKVDFSSGSSFDVTEMVLKHQLREIPLSSNTSLNLGAYLLNQHGIGMGNFTASLVHTVIPNELSMAINSEMGATPRISCEVNQRLDDFTNISIQPLLSLDETQDPFDCIIGCHHLLYDSTTAHDSDDNAGTANGGISYSLKHGINSSLSLADKHHHKLLNSSIALNPQSGVLQFQSKYEHDFFYQDKPDFFTQSINPTTRAKIGFACSLNGLALSLGCGNWLSRRSRISFGVSLTSTSGISLRLGYTRGSTRFTVPVILSYQSLIEKSVGSLLLTSSLPLVFTSLLKYVMKPKLDKQKKRSIEEAASDRISYLTHARQTALAQQKLMKRLAKTKTDEEKSRKDNGLVILLARYGKNPSSECRSEESDIHAINLDVTIPLQFFVQDSRLYLNSRSKSSLLGFYDPCKGQYDENDASKSFQKPQLYIRYSFDGNVYEATFWDSQVVHLPSCHARMMGKAGTIC